MSKRSSTGELSIYQRPLHAGTVISSQTTPAYPDGGKGSVGVARQYSGPLGKVGNCQVVASLQYADACDTWPVNARLYLPRE